MKKFLLLIAAVASMTFVSCESCSQQPKPEENAEYQFNADEFSANLLAAEDSASAVGVIDKAKAVADSLFSAGNAEAAKSVLAKVKEVIENNKAALDAKIPGISAGLSSAVDAIGEKFNAAKEAAGEAVDSLKAAGAEAAEAAADKAGEVKDAAAAAAADAADKAKEAAQGAADAAKQKAAEGVDKAADAAKDLLKK